MSNSLIWYDRAEWEQKLRIHYNQQVQRPIHGYPFPMEEILYQLLLHAKVDFARDSVCWLEQLYIHYCDVHPDYLIKLQDLFEEGWLHRICDRWYIAAYIHEKYVNNRLEERIDKIHDFLFFLQTGGDLYNSGILIKDIHDLWASLQVQYPSLPPIKAFSDLGILSEDQKSFRQLSNQNVKEYLYLALIRLWHMGSTPEENANWVRIASQLHVSADILNLFDKKDRAVIVDLLADRIDSGMVPRLIEVNAALQRQHMLEAGKLQTELYDTFLLPKDPVGAFCYLRRFREKSRIDGNYFSFLFFEITAVMENLELIVGDKKDAILKQIYQMYMDGTFPSFFHFSPNICLSLLEEEETRFPALSELAFLHMDATRKEDSSAGNCILAWLYFYFRQDQNEYSDIQPITDLMLLLAENAFSGLSTGNVSRELMFAVFQTMCRFAVKCHSFLIKMTEQLIASLENAADDVTWGHRFHLICIWYHAFYSALPEETRKTDILKLMSQWISLWKKAFMPSDRQFLKFVADPQIFQYPFWYEIYQSANTNMQKKMQNPVVLRNIDENHDMMKEYEDERALYFVLAWLLLLQERKNEDPVIMDALEYTLYSALNGRFFSFSTQILQSEGFKKVLETAIGKMRIKQGKDHPLLTLSPSILVLLMGAITDKELKNAFENIIIKNVLQGADILVHDRWQDVVDGVLDNKLDMLYGPCEKCLLEYIHAAQRRKIPAQYIEKEKFRLSRLWFIQEEYQKILDEGSDWWKALIFTEKEPYQDLKQAQIIWKKLARENQDESAWLNLLLVLLRRLDQTEKDQNAQSLYKETECLIAQIEKEYYPKWPQKARTQFICHCCYYSVLKGATNAEAFDDATKRFNLSGQEKKDAIELWNKKEETMQPEVISAPAAQPADEVVKALNSFHYMTLAKKADCYFRCRSISNFTSSDLQLTLLQILHTLDHLSRFGDKLLIDGILYEDHCTQLFREMFNSRCSEWWGIKANDQQQSGSTGKINPEGLQYSSENDLLIKTDDDKIVFSIECIVLNTMKSNEVFGHLIKLVGDYTSAAPKALLIYGNSLHPLELWERITEYLTNAFPKKQESSSARFGPFISFAECPQLYKQDLFYNVLDISANVLVSFVEHDGAPSIPLFVIYTDIGKRANTIISKEARSRR